MNQAGTFADISLQSGIDFLEDGRGFAIGDFDQNGTLDFGITSNQRPRFRIATLQTDSKAQVGNFVRVRLVGGNKKATASTSLSSRDPVGAILIVKTANSTRMFQLSRGEGFSSQNSNTLHIGIGEDTQIERLEIRWPSGKITVKDRIYAGSLVKVRETEN